MIYMDYAATTPVDPDVYRAIQPFFMEVYGNPSSIHSEGRKARKAVETARKQCAKTLHCEPEQIFFTSGATEANNWAHVLISCGLIEEHRHSNRQYTLLCTATDHKSNSWCCRNHLIPIDKYGIIHMYEVFPGTEDDVDEPYVLSTSWVNNEIGTVQPMEELSNFCQKHHMFLHVDATQAVGKMPIDLARLSGIKTMSMSAHKIGGMKGVGLLFIRDYDRAFVHSFLHGGNQENGLRAGTENVPGIVGLGTAMEKISKSNFDNAHVSNMHEFLQCALSEIPAVRFNGDCEYQLPHYLNVSFKGIEGESLLLALDRRGICVSSGSACNSGSLEPSHVLSSIGVPDDYINGTIRISLSEQNTMEECITVAEAIKEEVAKLREISPTWKGE